MPKESKYGEAPGNIGVWTGNQWMPLHHPLQHIPHRGSDVEAFIKAARDRIKDETPLGENMMGWAQLDNLLDDYRLHADTGVMLDQKVTEADVGG